MCLEITESRPFCAALEAEPEAGFVFTSNAILVSMEAARKTGYLDSSYFGEIGIQDWFQKLRRQGFYGINLTEAMPQEILKKNPPHEFYYYKTRDQLIFLKKNTAPALLPFFIFFFMLGLPFRGRFRVEILAVLDFLRGRRGEWKAYHSRPFFLKFFLKMQTLYQTFVQKVRFFYKKSMGLPLNIVVCVNWRIGDEIMAIPVYEALRKKYPTSFIYAEVNNPCLLDRNPFINETGSNTPKADLRIDLQREDRHRPRKDFLAEVAGVGPLADPRIYLSSIELESAGKKRSFQPGQMKIAVAPYPKWDSRRWPEDRWNALAEYFIRRYQAQVLIFGKDEKPLSAGLNLIGQTDLRETAALIAGCDLFVGPDSGPLHLALAVGTPSVGLFGPLNPSFLTPTRESYIPVWTELECRGCWPEGRMKNPDECPKMIPDCMTSISLESVLKACDTLLACKGKFHENTLR